MMGMESYDEKLKELCGKLFDVQALKFGDFKMKVGINSPVYFDLRVTVSHPSLMDELADLIIARMKLENFHPKVICGVPYTALPFSTLVSVKSNLPMLIRRKEPKKYGTLKLIEGSYNAGDDCLIIEDVVTSGSSILETANDLRHDGMLVSNVIVIIDREQGGRQNLESGGIKVHSLLTLSKALEILHSLGKIEKSTIESVRVYIQANQILPNGAPLPKEIPTLHWKMTYTERAALTSCELSKRLFSIMEMKKTNLCFAVDVPKSADLLKLVESVGEYCAVIKTHYDAVLDWSVDTEKALKELAKKNNLIIMEDRKYSDIGNTLRLQMEKVKDWADVVTMHSLAGPSFIPVSPLPVFLLAQMSSSGNLISADYTRATMEMAERNGDKVAGIVCTNGSIIKSPGYVMLRPGVGAQKGADGLGQTYTTPEDAICVDGGDLVVIGRAIYAAPNPQDAAKELRSRLWNAYTKRVSE